MQRRLLACLLFIVSLFLSSTTFSSGKPSVGEGVYNPSAMKFGFHSSRLSKQGARGRRPNQGRRQVIQSSSAEERVTVLPRVVMEDIDSEIEPFSPVPMIVLRQGQTYRVEQRYKNNNYATLHAGFSKWEPTAGHPKGFWVFQDQDILNWSNRTGDNQGEGVLKADDYPSGKCLITFWSHSEAVATDAEGSRYRYVPFKSWRSSKRKVQERNTTVFIFEFKDEYTTATVSLYQSR